MKIIGIYKFLFGLCFVVAPFFAHIGNGQAVGMNTTTPHASALLDVTSTNKGLLIPRMTEAEKNLISMPQHALMIYQTDGFSGFYYYDMGTTSWKAVQPTSKLINDQDADTKLETEKTNNDNIIRITLSGSEKMQWLRNIANIGRINILNNDGNVSIGDSVGAVYTTAKSNVGIGYSALRSSTAEQHFIAIGNNALYKANYPALTLGQSIAIGHEAIKNCDISNTNIGLGSNSLSLGNNFSYSIGIGYDIAKDATTSNIFIGKGSGKNMSDNNVSRNIIIGAQALDSITNQDSGIAIGYKASSRMSISGAATAIGSRAVGYNDRVMAIGYKTLALNQSEDNMALGSEALSNINASDLLNEQNFAYGYKALSQATTAKNNIAVGSNALANILNKSYNIAVGSKSQINSTGENNVSVGNEAMGMTVDTSGGNTVIGSNAMNNYNNVGNLNTLIGYNTEVASGVSNSIAIGANAYAAVSNAIILGSTAGINGANNSAQVGIGVTAPHNSAALHLKSNNKGLGLPNADTSNISNPIEGLLTFMPDVNPYYYNGNKWKPMNHTWPTDNFGCTEGQTLVFKNNSYQPGYLHTIKSQSPYNTQASVESTTNNDQFKIKLLGENNTYEDKLVMRENSYGQFLIETPNNHQNFYMGSGTYFTGTDNVRIGLTDEAIYGSSNVSIGYNTLSSHAGNKNIAIGNDALRGSDDREENIAIGQKAGYDLEAQGCLAIGYQSYNTLANLYMQYNSAIGAYAYVDDDANRSTALGFRSKVIAPDCVNIGCSRGDNGAIYNTNIGINIKKPKSALHVKGPSSTTNPHLLLEEASSNIPYFQFKHSGTSVDWNILGKPWNTLNDAILFMTFNTADALRLEGDGDATLYGTLTQNSDMKLKKDTIALNNVLDKIENLHSYTYYWKDEKNKAEQVGLIAQEVEKVYPELVQKNDDGFLSVNYIAMNAVLLQGLKELKNKSDSIAMKKLEQENKIKVLKDKITKLGKKESNSLITSNQ